MIITLQPSGTGSIGEQHAMLIQSAQSPRVSHELQIPSIAEASLPSSILAATDTNLNSTKGGASSQVESNLILVAGITNTTPTRLN